MSLIRGGFGIGLLILLAAQPSSIQAQNEPFEWSSRMGSGQTLEVKGIVGNIRATLASGSEARVIARKRGDKEDFQQVAVEMAEDGDRIIICAVYGSWNHGENRCHPDHRNTEDPEDRRNRNVDMDVSVDYEVQVPSGVEFDAAMVSGDVEAEGLRSDVSVSTVDGTISVITTGRAWANSVSGDIEIRMGDFSGGDLDFKTVSGDITLWLPSDFTADLEFSSLSGDFDSDFDMEVRDLRRRMWVGSKIEGKIGGGGRDLSFNTISGDVRLRRVSR
jgi:hypothetical protein